jgi:histidine triad (HIT) family protein
MDPNCIFCKIVHGQIPTAKVYEDDEVIVFNDINPAAPIHLLLVPREHVESLMTVGPQHQALVGRMLLLAPRLAREQGSTNGFRVVINNGPGGGQEMFHLHMHVLAGPRPWKRTL